MIGRLLIANRGEIARRIIRTCDRLGVQTVAVYSDADVGAPHVREATTAVRIGPAPARESYLDMDAVLAAARDSGADAVHPGCGFLSENAEFAERVIAAGLTWVGPPPAAIRAMGLKDAAKRLMAEAGVPVTPGYLGNDQSPERLAAEAERIGFPVLIKAVAGGGGKGMRRVDAAEGFAAALASAKREAASSFGDERVLLERYANRPRHIEVQVFADTHGNVVHLYERDCSLQRRHQKVIEEAPAPGMSPEVRASVCAAAVKAAQAVAYEGAGTVEFIADASEGLRADRIWFMEMNTRLQVEHPVTEMITGQDLVEWQLRVASGEPLPLTQDAIPLNGWAMEARLYAENPANGFLPSTGTLEHFRLPFAGEGVRVDSGVEQGGEVTPFYDPMIAKLIAWAGTREAAGGKLAKACKSVEVWPVKTNAAFLARCLEQPDFVAGQVDTGFIGERLPELIDVDVPRQVRRAAVEALYYAELNTSPVARDWQSAWSPWHSLGSSLGFRMNGARSAQIIVDFGQGPYPEQLDLRMEPVGLPFRLLSTDEVVVFEGGSAHTARRPRSIGETEGAASTGQLSAPMPGRIVSVSAEVGEAVKRGAAIVTLEAMKMEHGLTAPFDGRVAEVSVALGDQVVEGAVLARLVPL